jgi:hypothetical protein
MDSFGKLVISRLFSILCFLFQCIQSAYLLYFLVLISDLCVNFEPLLHHIGFGGMLPFGKLISTFFRT